MTTQRCLWLAVLVVVAGTANAQAEAPRREEPFLGAYVHYSTWFRGKRDQAAREQAIVDNVERFRESGLRVLIPFVTSTDGEAGYASQIIADKPWGDWDPLAVLVREARERGLRIYPTMCVLASGGERPAGVLRAHPEWALRGKNDEPLGFISPGHPEARTWVVSVLKEIATKYQPDGILLDYCRYPGTEARMDAVAQARFDASHPADKFPPDSGSHKEAFRQFKRDCLTELVGQISGELRALRPKPRIAVYMWGAHELKNTRDWRTWAAQGYLDMLNLTGYSYRERYGDKYLDVLDANFRDVAAVLKEVGKPVEFTICVGISTSHGKIREAREIEDYLNIAKRRGVHGASIFTWESLQPYLPEVKQARYLERFTAGLQPAPAP